MGTECGKECFASLPHDPVRLDGDPVNGAIECPCDRPGLVVVNGVIQSAWRVYEKEVVPVHAGTVQRAECCKSFFGGASIVVVAIMESMGTEALVGGKIDPDLFVVRVGALVQQIYGEATAFATEDS